MDATAGPRGDSEKRSIPTEAAPRRHEALDPEARERRLFRQVSSLFFLSGAIGLGYEILWFKRFSQLWGNSTFALAAVVSSFLLGLGLGAFLLGKAADRMRTPLFWYGMCEIGIGITAILIPFQINVLFRLYPWLGEQTSGFFSGAPAKFLLTFLVLAPPCILMGGSLPLILKQFAPLYSSLKRYSGWLYAINTLGAASGCYLAGFHLLPRLGLHRFNAVLAALSLLVGVGAFLLARGLDRPDSDRSRAATRSGEAAPAVHRKMRDEMVPAAPAILFVALLAGFGSLALEVAWTRQLVLIVGGSTYAFTAMLTVFLFGIGLGSLLFHAFLAGRSRLGPVAPLIVLGLIVSTLLGKWAIPTLTFAAGGLSPLRESAFLNAVLCLGASSLLVLLPTAAMGLLFPLLLQLAALRMKAAGRAVGSVYGWNILGSIAGAAAASLLLIPRFGVSFSLAVALLSYTVALMLLFPSLRSWKQTGRLFACLVLAFAAVLLSAVREEPRITNLGFYLYGIPAQMKIPDTQVLFFKEGAAANVLVTDTLGVRSLRINGKVEASDTLDMNTQLGLAYFSLFQNPGARDILVIGYGSGTTPGAALLMPGSRVTCCEIEPAVYAASKHFADVNHTPYESPRFSVVFDDGRSYLQGARKSFDLIISEPSNPWISGVSNLFTREFYELAAARLNEGGILAQWIQEYSFSAGDYALAVRTLQEVFPEVRLIRISEGDTILLASRSSLAHQKAALERAQDWVDSTPAVAADLEEYFGTVDVRTLLLTHTLLGSSSLAALVERIGGSGINTDLNLRLEFDSPLRLFGGSKSPEEVAREVLSGVEASWIRRHARELELTAQHAPAFHSLASLFEAEERPELVREIVAIGLELDAEDPQLVADRLILAKEFGAADFARDLERLLETSEEEASRLSKSLWEAGAHESALMIMERLVGEFPHSVTAWTNLAITYQDLERRDEAEATFRKALSLDPLSGFALSSYRAFQAEPDSATPVARQGVAR